MGLSHEHAGLKILAKSKSISSAEPNYFVHFAMRYPVEQVGTTGGNPQRRSNTQ